jgi:hypothetical protein
MKTPLLCLVCAVIFVATAAFADPVDKGWFLYWIGPDGSEAWTTTDKVYSVRGNRVMIASYLDYPGIGRHAVAGEIFDCSTQQYTLLSTTEFDRNERPVKDYNNPNPAQTWKPLTPGDRQSALFNGICEKRSGRPYSLQETRRYFENLDREARKIRGR